MHEWIEQKKVTVLMICHDMDLVCKHATRVVVLRDGRVVGDGPPGDVFYQSYEILKEMRLLSPTVVDASRSFVGSKLSRVLLSIDEFKDLVHSTLETRAMEQVG